MVAISVGGSGESETLEKVDERSFGSTDDVGHGLRTRVDSLRRGQ